MLIIVKDFKWTQNEDQIIIQVPLKNASKQVDIVTHENFIKIHALPYYFEAFLLHPIIEDESRCTLTNDLARFCLKKFESIEWTQLERQFADKAEKAQFKSEILQHIEEKLKANEKSKLEKKDRIKRSEVGNAMAKDAQIRESIENVQKLAIAHEMEKVVEIKKIEPKPTKVIPQKKAHEVPAIRKSAEIEIQFSKRNFVTPKRESQDPAEQEWILKQMEARKAIGFVAEDLRPEERDPIWLKEKGDTFFRQNNYLAAISAYSTGIKLANKCHELYMNRSAAHFAQGNYKRCAEDCSTSLDLMNPPCALNLKSRCQALARRGAALCKLGFLREAYIEFVAAVKLDPSNDSLRHDAEQLRAKLENCYDDD